MNIPTTRVHPQITDALTQSSSHVLGLGPAVSAINGYLGQALALSVLAANMVSQQQQQALVSLAVTTRNVRELHGGGRTAAAPVFKVQEPSPAAASGAAAPAPAPFAGPGSPVVY